jgi:predicted glycosyltransferase
MKPVLYLYCQHSLGMGHLVRSLALARAMSATFEVHVLSGGQAPDGFAMPSQINVHHLPALGMRGSDLVSLEPGLDVEAVKASRLSAIGQLLTRIPPDVLVTELYPFGRKKFAFELDLLIAAAHRRRAPVICSVRDLLVSARADQQRHDDRAAQKLNAAYDAVVVHADRAFARLEETFRPSISLDVPVHYSGFVIPNPPSEVSATRERRVVVSAGGGIVGGPLFRAAIDMHASTYRELQLPMTLVAGPFLPDADWNEIQSLATGIEGLTLLRSTPDLCALMNRVTHSISQFGYNTAIDLMVAGPAAVVIPYAAGNETEQTVRAERLAAAGMISVVPEQMLSAATLAIALRSASAPSGADAFALDGANQTARILQSLLGDARRERTAMEATT